MAHSSSSRWRPSGRAPALVSTAPTPVFHPSWQHNKAAEEAEVSSAPAELAFWSLLKAIFTSPCPAALAPGCLKPGVLKGQLLLTARGRGGGQRWLRLEASRESAVTEWRAALLEAGSGPGTARYRPGLDACALAAGDVPPEAAARPHSPLVPTLCSFTVFPGPWAGCWPKEIRCRPASSRVRCGAGPGDRVVIHPYWVDWPILPATFEAQTGRSWEGGRVPPNTQPFSGRARADFGVCIIQHFWDKHSCDSPGRSSDPEFGQGSPGYVCVFLG